MGLNKNKGLELDGGWYPLCFYECGFEFHWFQVRKFIRNGKNNRRDNWSIIFYWGRYFGKFFSERGLRVCSKEVFWYKTTFLFISWLIYNPFSRQSLLLDFAKLCCEVKQIELAGKSIKQLLNFEDIVRIITFEKTFHKRFFSGLSSIIRSRDHMT